MSPVCNVSRKGRPVRMWQVNDIPSENIIETRLNSHPGGFAAWPPDGNKHGIWAV